MTENILQPLGRISCSLILLTDTYFTRSLKVPVAEMPYFHIQSVLHFAFLTVIFLSYLTEIIFATLLLSHPLGYSGYCLPFQSSLASLSLGKGDVAASS